jgi:hypothetical protein
MINQLRKVLLTSTLLIASVLIAQESAQAQFFVRHSGSPNVGDTFFEFDINPTVLNTSSNPEEGLFKNAIINAKYICATKITNFCSNKPDNFTLFFKPANIKASKINGTPSFSDAKVKYEGRLESINSSDFQDFQILFSPSFKNGSPTPFNFGVLTSLDTLGKEIENNNIETSVGVNVPNFSDRFFRGSGSLRVEKITVPEPNSNAGLVGIGTLGTYLLFKSTRKRKHSNKYSSKHAA